MTERAKLASVTTSILRKCYESFDAVRTLVSVCGAVDNQLGSRDSWGMGKGVVKINR